MSSYISCSGTLVINADQTLSCDNWQQSTAQQIAQEAGIQLTSDDFLTLKTFVVLVFVFAFGVRIVRNIFLARAVRE